MRRFLEKPIIQFLLGVLSGSAILTIAANVDSLKPIAKFGVTLIRGTF